MYYQTLCILSIALAYFLKTRIWDYYRTMLFYTSQGVEVAKGSWRPIVGSALEVLALDKRHKAGELRSSVTHEMCDVTNNPKATIVGIGMRHTIVVHSYEVVRDLFVSQNAVLDKTAQMTDLLVDLFGNSLIFMPNNDLWKQKRAVLRTGFYKEKMGDMF